MSKLTHAGINNGTSSHYTEDGYQYDNLNNPYYKLGVIYYLATDQYQGLSAHNLLGQQIQAGTYTIEYNYNKSNIPVSCKSSISTSVGLSNELTRTYYYWH